jgi:hypothetical protein
LKLLGKRLHICGAHRASGRPGRSHQGETATRANGDHLGPADRARFWSFYRAPRLGVLEFDRERALSVRAKRVEHLASSARRQTDARFLLLLFQMSPSQLNCPPLLLHLKYQTETKSRLPQLLLELEWKRGRATSLL